MLFFVISVCSFALLLSKSLLPLHPLPSWTSETRLLSFLSWRELLQAAAQLLRLRRAIASAYSLGYSALMPTKRRCERTMDAADEVKSTDMSILDLPELALECILEKLPPAGLSSMAHVCSSLRERCRRDYLWERHMREKWGRVVGRTALREWRFFLASRKDEISMVSGGKLQKAKWIAALSCVWPVSWLSYKILRGAGSSKTRDDTFLPDDSIMSWYQSLEGGKFWFPAQVYNREHGHVGFMLSCYDAEVSYDCHTDSFHARYPPHGRRTIVIEEGVQWDRLRAPPVDTPAHDLHISDCMNDLCPGDHIEIQWRRNKEFPYGWWYGVVGHLESCDGNALFCRCQHSNTVVLQFNQYTSGSRWRTTSIDRINHREEGNETDGFYGGIRKLRSAEEIAKWKQLWPTDILE